MTGARGGGRSGGSRSLRAAVLAPVVLVLVAPVPGAVAGPPRVAGTTVFTATRNASAVVRIPSAATLVVEGAESPHVDVSGAGRIVGFTFTPLRRPDGRMPMTLVALQMGLCAQARCRPVAPYKTFEYVDASPGLPTRVMDGKQHVTLPSGDYAVRAVTDGAPVRLTLRLSGLSGRSAITVTRPYAVPLRTGSSTGGGVGIDPLRNVGATHRFHSDLGFMMHMVLAEYEPHVRSHVGVCYYLDARPPTGRYHPTCPNAAQEFTYMAGYPTLHYYGAMYGSDTALRAGEWTLGFYLTGAGGKSSLTAVTLWVELG